MKKIKLYDYQQKMLEDIINVLTSKATSTFYNENGKKERVRQFGDGADADDCPDVEFIKMARPTLSLAKYLQMVGRGLRINHENKDKVCMIIDNVG